MLVVWRRVVIGSAIAVYVAGLGCAGGVVLKRMRADRAQDAALQAAAPRPTFQVDWSIPARVRPVSLEVVR